MTRISILGLGAMGSALAAILTASNHELTVWNRTPQKAEALVAKGARLAASATEAIEATDIVIICLLDYSSVEDVVKGAAGGLAGRVVVNLTNGTPAEARSMARRVEDMGAVYLDGGIMAVPPMIGSREAMILYSGDAAAFTAHERILAELATPHYLGADPGLAPLHDMALLAGMYGLFGGFLHAMALVGTEGVKAEAFLPLLEPWLQAMMTTLPGLARNIDAAQHDQDVVSNLAMQARALTGIVKASREQGIRPDFLLPMERLAAARDQAGFGTDDISGVIEVIRQPIHEVISKS